MWYVLVVFFFRLIVVGVLEELVGREDIDQQQDPEAETQPGSLLLVRGSEIARVRRSDWQQNVESSTE